MDSPGGRERRPRSEKRPPARLSLRVDKADQETGLAEFCAKRGGISLEDARAAIDRGGAYVNGKRVREAARAMKQGESVTLHLRERGLAPHADALGLERILYLDEHLLAIDKPAGVLAQEGLAGGPDLPSLASALLGLWSEKESHGEIRSSGESKARGEQTSRGERASQLLHGADEHRALLVHRLDRGTTGVTLLARTRAAQAALLESFREGRVEKEYLALCAGAPPEDRFEVDLALGADENLAGRRALDANGQMARTRFQVLKRWPDAASGVALIAAFPETGRTHQIRVHLSARSLPLLGDARYDGPRFVTRNDGQRLDLERPMLHARSIALPHPAPKTPGEMLHVEAPDPADLRAAVAFLEGSGKK